MSVEAALLAAGESGAAAIWRTARRDLAGPLRLAVLARDPAVAARFAATLSGDWTVVPREVTPNNLGLLDDLLGVHALIWATPANAPLPAAERALLDTLSTAPGLRAVVITDLALLDRISDDPETEAAEIRARIGRLLPEDWPLRTGLDATPDLRAERTAQVATTLIDGALDRMRERSEELAKESARIDQLLLAEDAALEHTRKDAARVAAHVLSAMRRHTEQLLVDIRDLLVRVEQDLAAQVHGVDDLDLARRALPHWLQHVIDTALDQGLANWRAAVLADLAELDVDTDASDHAELLLPSLHPPPFTRQTGWGRRLAMTAALGGAALLAAAGLWVPTLLALGGSFAWSTWARDTDENASRDGLIDAAREALREMGRSAEQVLNDQLEAMGDELDELQDDREGAMIQAQADLRAELQQAKKTLSGTTAELGVVTAILREAR